VIFPVTDLRNLPCPIKIADLRVITRLIPSPDEYGLEGRKLVDVVVKRADKPDHFDTRWRKPLWRVDSFVVRDVYESKVLLVAAAKSGDPVIATQSGKEKTYSDLKTLWLDMRRAFGLGDEARVRLEIISPTPPFAGMFADDRDEE
jgi:hypothetical protein